MVTQSIPLVADLRTQNRNIGTIYLATGLVTEGDTGGGIYFWNPASTNADDGFYYLQVTGVTTGRWVRIYAGSNIYNTDGSLLDNRDVTLNGNYLKLIGSSANSTFNADGSVTLSSLSGADTRMVVAGTTGTLSTQSFVPGTTIRFVEKFTAIAGQTVFNTANTLYGDLFDVFLNGVKLNTDSFSFTANQITLLDGSYAGDIIDVVGFSSATGYASLPSQAGNAGKFLSTDGTSLSWETVSVSGFVPYTGATADVNLGEFALSAGQLTLDVSPTGTASVGTTRWNNTIGSSETTLKGGSVVLKNGVDLVARIVNKVSPNTTLTKANYQAVRVSGAQGQRLAVAYAQANNDANSADTIGLVCETIPTNQEGFIITMGQLENINTTGSLQGETWADGDVLYLSPFTAGAVTKVKPTGAGHIVVIGYVEYAHVNNGKIYVKVMNGWELDELHDVDIVTPANNEALIYESSTALWKNKTIATALGYTPISGSGVTGQVAYWNGTNSQTGSNNLFWDAANSQLTISTNANAATSSVRGLKVINTNSAGYANTLWANDTTDVGQFMLTGTAGAIAGTNILARQANFINAGGTGGVNLLATAGNISFLAGSGSTSKMILFQTGNLVINNTSDGGQRLQVYGDAYIKGSGNTSATSALLVQNSSSQTLLSIKNNGQTTLTGITNNDTTNIFRIEQQNGNGRFLVNATGQILVAGDAFQSSENFISISRNAFNPTSGSTTHTSLLIVPTINQTGGANGITRGLYVNPTLSAAADWRSIEWSNNSGWGLYGAGTADNFLGGNLTISRNQNGGTIITVSNTTSGVNSLSALRVQNTNINSFFDFTKFSSTTTAYKIILPNDAAIYNSAFAGDISMLNDSPTGRIKFAAGASSTAQMTLTAAGRLLLGLTAESTFLLDVNGTARVSGKSLFGSSENTGVNAQFQINHDSSSVSTVLLSNTNSALGADFNMINNSGNVFRILQCGSSAPYPVANQVTFNSQAGGYYFCSAGVFTANVAMAIFPTTKNVGIGTGITDAGFKLDVNGTARVSGSLIGAGATGAGSGSVSFGTGSTSAGVSFGVAMGYQSTASASHAIAIGYGAVASANPSYAFGYDAIASGANSTAFSNGRAIGNSSIAGGFRGISVADYSVAFGYQSRGYLNGQFSISSSNMSYNGDSQASIVSFPLNTGVVSSGGTYSFTGIRPSNGTFGSGVSQIWRVEVSIVFAVKGKTASITQFNTDDTFTIVYQLAVKSNLNTGTAIIGTPILINNISDTNMATTSVSFSIVSNNLVASVTPPTWVTGQAEFRGTIRYDLTELGNYPQIIP